jgi:SNF2 family DNA or RNA helicase
MATARISEYVPSKDSLVKLDIAPTGNAVDVTFPYDSLRVALMRTIPGARFFGKDRGGPFWRVPLDLTTMRRMRRAFPDMALSRELRVWGHKEVHKEQMLGEMSTSASADLPELEARLPQLHTFASSRPYQMADIAFMAAAENVLNANAPSLGKTIETIGAIFEAGHDHSDGAHLIIAPITSLDVVWRYELKRWTNFPVLIASGSRALRYQVLKEAIRLSKLHKPFFLVINPAMVRQLTPHDKALSFPQLQQIPWKTVVIDEFHKCGLGNPQTSTRAGLMQIKADRKIALSGTPIGGKAIKLWGVLNWLYPDVFTSKWRWADEWLGVTKNQWGSTIGREVFSHRLAEFTKVHARYMVRRTKEEVRKELPDKNRIDIWCDMATHPEQQTQYRKFEKDAFLRMDEAESEGTLSATSVLAEYTRLRQFAIAKQTLKEGEIPFPTTVSCKLEQLERIIEDHVGGDLKNPEGTEQIVVFSQFSKVVDMVEEHLRTKYNLKTAKLTGATKEDDRANMIRTFELQKTDDPKIRVLCISTTAGGVAITLNNSNAVIFMDETFVPDDQEQAEDRNRNNTATIYYIRTKNTIEERVKALTDSKAITNYTLLDLKRLGPMTDRGATNGDKS